MCKRILHHSPTTRLCELVACLATLPPWQSSPRKARNAWNAWNPSQWYKNEYGKSCQHIQLQEEGNSWRSPTSCSPNGPHVFFKHCLAAAQQHAKAHDTQNSHGFFRLQNCRDDRVGFQSQVNLIGLSPMFAKLGLPKQCPNVPNWHVYKCTNIGRGRERERMEDSTSARTKTWQILLLYPSATMGSSQC